MTIYIYSKEVAKEILTARIAVVEAFLEEHSADLNHYVTTRASSLKFAEDKAAATRLSARTAERAAHAEFTAHEDSKRPFFGRAAHYEKQVELRRAWRDAEAVYEKAHREAFCAAQARTDATDPVAGIEELKLELLLMVDHLYNVTSVGYSYSLRLTPKAWFRESTQEYAPDFAAVGINF